MQNEEEASPPGSGMNTNQNDHQGGELKINKEK